MQQFDNNEYGEGYELDNRQRPPPSKYQVRPRVNPEADGEVDPTQYPQAKEATHKIRGRHDIIELLCGSVDQELLFVKCFYFFFYSAFGSLFPLMGVFFKQMGMNPGQCGILVGSRPFVEFLSAPFWGSYADRTKKGKILLLASVASWIIFTLPVGLIQPTATACIRKLNDTSYQLDSPKYVHTIKTRSIIESYPGLDDYNDTNGPMNDATMDILQRSKRAARPIEDAGISPLDVSYADNFKAVLHRNWLSPLFTSVVYTSDDIHKAFFLLLLLIIIGEFFAAPAITLADSAVITMLGDDADKYGQQRMFGSLGWGIAMFFVGIALDHSTSFPNHPCGPEAREKNYTICFATFSVLMGAAFLTATQINFKFDSDSEETVNPEEPAQQSLTAEEEMQNQLAAQLNLPSLAAPASGGLSTAGLKQEVLSAKTKMFAQTTKQMPEWYTVLKHYKNLKCASFLFVAWFMGFGIGMIFTFLFWHLQDYGGTPTLFGVASVINHVSEICAYFFSFRLIQQMGHVKVLCLGLTANVLRFLYISYIQDPWWVLPFEFMQGITHAAVWAACCSYISHNTPPELRNSAQGVLQGIHHGLGRGCGAVIGGFFASAYGTKNTFRGYGVICLLVLGAFVFINFYRKDEGFVSDLPDTEDPREVAEDTSHLAPHGVPTNPIPRALSNSRLNDMNTTNGQQSYGTYQTTGGNLDIPGAQRNPFSQ